MSLNLTLLVASQSQPDVTVNEITNILEADSTATVTIDVNGDANYTLDTATGNPPFEWQNFQLNITNGGTAWTGPHNIDAPAEAKLYLVYNNALGQTLTFQVTGGAGVGQTVATGVRSLIYCDGTDMIKLL